MSRERAIFFDVDDTLIAMKSMFAFQRYYFAHAAEHAGDDADALMDRFRAELSAAVPDGRREALNRAFYRSFAGRSACEVERLADAWFATLQPSVWIESACALLEERRAQGYLIVGVSGSSHEILRGVARHLRLDHVLAARLERNGDLFTGALSPPQTIGEGKRLAILQLAKSEGLDLARCSACGDHASDLSMLECVGEPIIVAGDPTLEAIASMRGWAILPRGGPGDATAHV